MAYDQYGKIMDQGNGRYTIDEYGIVKNRYGKSVRNNDDRHGIYLMLHCDDGLKKFYLFDLMKKYWGGYAWQKK